MNDFIKKLGMIVGPEHVIVTAPDLERLSRSSTPYRELPSCAAKPGTAQEVQSIVRLSLEYNMPIWPVSTGKNFGYGEKSACYPGGLTLILERMNAIHHVDPELGYAVIEPGVTYHQLNAYLKTHYPDLWSDCAGTTQYASVIGNALDKGRGLTPYGDHFGALCGMDVVLPNGDMLETGGVPNNSAVRHLYKWGVGPYLDGIFAQSNFGIVVRAGIWLMPKPEKFEFAAFEYMADMTKFPAFIDDIRRLSFKKALISYPHIANDFAMMCIVSQYPHDLLKGKKCLDENDIEAWRLKHNVARWTFGMGLYGSPAEVTYQKKTLKRVLRRYGRIQFLGIVAKQGVIGNIARQVATLVNRWMGKSQHVIDALIPAINLFKGIPTDFFVRQVYFKSHIEKPDTDIDPARDGCGLIWIGPVIPFTGQDVKISMDLARTLYQKHHHEMFVEWVIESPRTIIALFGIFYNQKDPEDTARAQEWYQDMRDVFIKSGYPPYRTTTMSMANSGDVNPVGQDFLKKIKNGIDPGHMIAPGRYGI